MAMLHRLPLPRPRPFSLPRPHFRIPKRISLRWLLVLAGLFIVAVGLVQVNQLSRVTSAGYEIDRLNQERAQKQAENSQIEADVARLSSLARVDIEARMRLGMVPAQARLYLTLNHSVPDRQTLPTRFLPVVRPQPAPSNPPLWKRLLHKLPLF